MTWLDLAIILTIPIGIGIFVWAYSVQKTDLQRMKIEADKRLWDALTGDDQRESEEG